MGNLEDLGLTFEEEGSIDFSETDLDNLDMNSSGILKMNNHEGALFDSSVNGIFDSKTDIPASEFSYLNMMI